MLRYLCALGCSTAFLLSLLATSGLAAEKNSNTPVSVKTRSQAKAPSWFLQETKNFRIYCCASAKESQRLGERCEELRQQLCTVWLGSQPTANWTKRCDVVVFPDLASYLQVVGQEASQTAGSALIESNGTMVTSRRIDLRGDLGMEMQSALAHELTHVVIADRIDRSHIPAWADEGMAVLADSPEKQALHLADLRDGVRDKQTFRAGELIGLTGYPHPQRMGVFYGQSGSLVSFLVHRGTPEQFVRFLEMSLKTGYDAGLRKVYDIESVAQLEQLWLKSLQTGETSFASYVPGEIWSKPPVVNEG